MQDPRPSQRDVAPAVVWFRRDLRLDDNPAWNAACAAHTNIVALVVLEHVLLDAASAARRERFLHHLGAVDAELRERQGHLTVRYGPAAQAVAAVVAESGASALYINHDQSPFAKRRDAAVAAALDVPIHGFDGNLVHPPGSILTKAGRLSLVFTPFFRRWLQQPLPDWPEPVDVEVVGLRCDTAVAPGAESDDERSGGTAWRRLDQWLDRVDDYVALRDDLATDGTSGLSSDLKFGALAARTVVDVVGTSSPGREAFVRQLAWRDWWAHTLAVHPDLAAQPRRSDAERIAWRNDRAEFDAWCAGQTGFPVVDAAMRQLVATGWMHNRARMICASFLVKDLLIDWRRGERFFRHHLLDADLAQNAGNWQWVAGTGPDAAPYFRIFNPTIQSRRHDPSGAFIRQWVPELASLDDDSIHEPSVVGPLVLASSGVIIGRDYPEPLVDHSEARARALGAYSFAFG